MKRINNKRDDVVARGRMKKINTSKNARKGNGKKENGRRSIENIIRKVKETLRKSCQI